LRNSYLNAENFISMNRLLAAKSYTFEVKKSMNVAVICGGLSSEYEISIKSAQTIIDNFPKQHRCHRIVMNPAGWWYNTPEDGLPIDKNDFTVHVNGTKLHFDLALIYIHGFPGEDGKVQAYLDMLGVPYLNSNALSSELAFDKWFCNQFVKPFGIPVPESFLFLQANDHSQEEVIAKLGLPLFIKPCDSGSSFGVSKVNETNDYEAAMTYAFAEGKSVVAEQFVNGVEVTCGVYRSKAGIITLPTTEIVSDGEFFDYAAKYEGKSREITPARISKELTEKIQQYTAKVYQILRLRSIARIDFIIENDKPYMIEVNCTPGFSPASIVPQQIATSGRTIEQCWQEILDFEFPESKQ